MLVSGMTKIQDGNLVKEWTTGSKCRLGIKMTVFSLWILTHLNKAFCTFLCPIIMTTGSLAITIDKMTTPHFLGIHLQQLYHNKIYMCQLTLIIQECIHQDVRLVKLWRKLWLEK